VFLAYACLGSCLFWRLELFSDLKSSSLTLMALMLGDNVLYASNLIIQESVLGFVYLITFLLIFIIGIHNVLISIICDKIQKLENRESYLRDEEIRLKIEREIQATFLKK